MSIKVVGPVTMPGPTLGPATGATTRMGCPPPKPFMGPLEPPSDQFSIRIRANILPTCVVPDCGAPGTWHCSAGSDPKGTLRCRTHMLKWVDDIVYAQPGM